jgi:hypothetical protein
MRARQVSRMVRWRLPRFVGPTRGPLHAGDTMPTMTHERRGITIRQAMKLVAFAALTSACIAPGFRVWELGIGTARDLVLLEAATVPLAWAAASFVLVRRGPSRDRAVTSLMLCPVSIGLGYAVWCLLPLLRAIGSPRGWSLIPNAREWLLALIAVTLTLATAWVFLCFRLIQRGRQRPAA